VKPTNRIKRLCLRGNLEGQWKYWADKTLTALTGSPWIYYQVPWQFAAQVQTRIDWLRRFEYPCPPNSLAVPHDTLADFRRGFLEGIALFLLLRVVYVPNGISLDVLEVIWDFSRSW
jgi:hypothetical protein